MVDDVFERFEALAARWDLLGLHQDVAGVLGDFEESGRPCIPTQLLFALDMFLVSYGPAGTRYDPS
ncbi:MAG: hypothetical protein ACRDQA_12730 [Nocardioidaceae bacterium]